MGRIYLAFIWDHRALPALGEQNTGMATETQPSSPLGTDAKALMLVSQHAGHKQASFLSARTHKGTEMTTEHTHFTRDQLDTPRSCPSGHWLSPICPMESCPRPLHKEEHGEPSQGSRYLFPLLVGIFLGNARSFQRPQTPQPQRQRYWALATETLISQG